MHLVDFMHKQLLQITLPNLCTPFLWVYLVFVSLCLSLYIYICSIPNENFGAEDVEKVRVMQNGSIMT